MPDYRCRTLVSLPVKAMVLAMVIGLAAPHAVAQSEDSAAPTAIGGGGGLIVGGLAVDVKGKTPEDARLSGWREAQRRAWPLLWARLSGQPAENAPRLTDSVLDSIVSAIEIEREEVGPTRYVARLAVVFDRARAASFLGSFADLARSPPLLVIPVLQDAAVRQAHETENPWLHAWARLRAGESPIDYIRIRPTPGDTILLSAWQTERSHLALWRNLVDRYQVADVLIPELILERSWQGGPLTAMLVARFGPTGNEVGRVKLTNQVGNVAELLDEAVRQADQLYTAALRSGRLAPDPDLLEPDVPLMSQDIGPRIGIEQDESTYRLTLRVATPDDSALSNLQRQLSASGAVSSVRPVSYAPGGESTVEVSATVPMDQLRYLLDRQGWRIEGNLLRARAAGEAPLPPPLVAEDATVEVAEPQGAPSVAREASPDGP